MVMRRQHVGENLLLALDTLRTHKFRSFLTLLGVLIGTTTVIAVASIITGLDQQLVDMAEQWGTRLLWVYKLQLGTPHGYGFRNVSDGVPLAPYRLRFRTRPTNASLKP